MTKATDEFNEYQKGYGTEDSPTWRDLAKKDAKEIPVTLLEENSPNLGSAKIPVERYTSHDYHREEVEKVWKAHLASSLSRRGNPGCGRPLCL